MSLQTAVVVNTAGRTRSNRDSPPQVFREIGLKETELFSCFLEISPCKVTDLV